MTRLFIKLTSQPKLHPPSQPAILSRPDPTRKPPPKDKTVRETYVTTKAPSVKKTHNSLSRLSPARKCPPKDTTSSRIYIAIKAPPAKPPINIIKTKPHKGVSTQRKYCL